MKKKIEKNPLWDIWEELNDREKQEVKDQFDSIGLDMRAFYRDTERVNGLGFSDFPEFKIKAYQPVFGETFTRLYETDNAARIERYKKRKQEEEEKRIARERKKVKTKSIKTNHHEKHNTHEYAI